MENDGIEIVRMYDDERMMKQYYLWQLDEEYKDRFCYTPVSNGKYEFTEEGWEAFRKSMMKSLKTHRVIYMLYNRKNDIYLGWACLADYNPRNKCAEISYFLPVGNRGKGYGSMLVERLLRIAFSGDFFWKLHKIFAETGSYNTASIRLLEKNGFQLDGRIRDHYWLDGEMYDQLVFTLLESEFHAK